MKLLKASLILTLFSALFAAGGLAPAIGSGGRKKNDEPKKTVITVISDTIRCLQKLKPLLNRSPESDLYDTDELTAWHKGSQRIQGRIDTHTKSRNISAIKKPFTEIRESIKSALSSEREDNEEPEEYNDEEPEYFGESYDPESAAASEALEERIDTMLWQDSVFSRIKERTSILIEQLQALLPDDEDE